MEEGNETVSELSIYVTIYSVVRKSEIGIGKKKLLAWIASAANAKRFNLLRNSIRKSCDLLKFAVWLITYWCLMIKRFFCKTVWKFWQKNILYYTKKKKTSLQLS